MTADTDPERRLDSRRLVLGVVLVTLVLTGPVVGLDVTRERPELGDGNATVSLETDLPSSLTVTHGRFGTDVSYVRIPDATVSVSDLEGSPRLLYSVTVPNLGVDRTVRRIVTDEGRVSLTPSDRALGPDSESGTYQGRLLIKLQSFEDETVLANRSIEVTVP